MNKAIDILKKGHPYPVDVFTEPSTLETKKAVKVLQDAGLNETKIFAHMARIGYDAAIRNLERYE